MEPTPLDNLIRTFSKLTANSSVDRAQVRGVAEKIEEKANRQGLTDSQARSILGLCLRGTSGRKPLRSSLASKLIQAVKPARTTTFGPDTVLSVVGALRGADRGGSTFNTGTRRDDGSDEESNSDIDRKDESVGSKRGRARVDVSVQAQALKLLVLLLAPVPLNSVRLELHEDQGQTDNGGSSTEQAQLPSSFLSAAARHALLRSYGVLFHFLDYEELRPYLCHLLCHLTRRKHVKSYRINKLLTLRNDTSSESHVSALLSIYANFYPDFLASDRSQASMSARLVGMGLVGAGATGLRYPSPHWLVQVNDIWVRPQRDPDDDESSQVTSDRPLKKARRGRRAAPAPSNALASSHVPPPAMLGAPEGSCLVTEVASPRSLGLALDRIELPAQLAAALGHHITTLAVLCQGNTLAYHVERILDWTKSVLAEELNLSSLARSHHRIHCIQRPSSSHRKVAAILHALHDLFDNIGSTTFDFARWLARSVLQKDQVWQGLDQEEKRRVCGLLELMPPKEWQALHIDFFVPLAKHARRASASTSSLGGREACLIIETLSNLLSRWARKDWASTIAILERGMTAHYGMDELSNQVDYIATLSEAVAFAHDLASSAVASHPSRVLVQHAALTLYESTSAESLACLHRNTVPSPKVLLLLSLSPYTGIFALSGVCAMVQQLRKQFQHDGEEDEDEARPERVKEARLQYFDEHHKFALNSIVVLLADLVWRQKAFLNLEDETGNEADIGMPIDVLRRFRDRCESRGESLGHMAALTRGATLAALAEVFANETAKHNGARQPIVQGATTSFILADARRRGFPSTILYAEFRTSFLRWLGTKKGARGIDALLSDTMRSLRPHASPRGTSQQATDVAISI